MALVTSSDMSGCCEFTVGYGNFLHFNSGKYGIEFDSTGGTDERIFGKDPTNADITKSAFWLEYIQLTAGDSSGGALSVMDGSTGLKIVTLPAGDSSYSGGLSQVWDFKDDPIACLTADATYSLCMSSTVKGFCGGFIKGYWGPVSL